jgi:hypothetical protein
VLENIGATSGSVESDSLAVLFFDWTSGWNVGPLMAARPSVLSIDPCFVVEWIPAEPIGRVAVASDGSVYVADSGNYRIQKFSPRPYR